jgi:putative nucleotidyltransferase with HDIG domain
MPRRVFIVLAAIFLVSVLHFATRTSDPQLHAWHIFFRKLFFIPILAGAVWFGLRGAVFTAFAVIGFYTLHLLFDWPRFHMERMNQVGEMASFLAFSVVAGMLVNLERRAEAKAEQLRRRAERDKISTVVASLSETLGARDPDTRDHSRRVAELASGFAHYLGLSRHEVKDLYLAGILHDIGKIGIRDDVLLKPDSLTPEEREKIMQHPRIAEKILAPIGFSDVIRTVAVHHENWDGSGYPEGLQGEAIPLAGRILAIADTYDALRSDRPYQQGQKRENRAREIMAEMSGSKLEEALLRRFWDFCDLR